MSRILVIKHGALGDVVLATGAFQAIRQHHKNDHITLLTTPPYAGMLRASGYFDDIWIDTRPKLYHPIDFFKHIEKIRSGGFSRVYDLQTSERTSWYFYLMRKPVPEWVGTAKGASHRHNTPERRSLHTLERQKQQLSIAGIENMPAPDISWLKSSIGHFNLPDAYALIISGGSEHRPGKRWPAHNYGTLCTWLKEKGIAPVLIGTQSEKSVISIIEAICPDTINLLGKTNLLEIAELARHARFAIGNDTGPMHIIAATGCPSLVLFSRFSNPALCAPRGPNVSVMQKEALSNLALEDVQEWAARHIQPA
ncbi:MAG TPA: glycosyltransferase family 9 protein [Rickettsiales bacterium]|nr:glycosyltransferase family 9 protein [Rickettsiales bacterium]